MLGLVREYNAPLLRQLRRSARGEGRVGPVRDVSQVRRAHDESTSFTKTIDGLNAAADRLVATSEETREHVEELKEATSRELEVARIDREWERAERGHLVTFGQTSRLPTKSDRATLRWVAVVAIPLFFVGGLLLLSLDHVGFVGIILLTGAAVVGVVAASWP